jgi:NAD(P)H-hydrate epimerase
MCDSNIMNRFLSKAMAEKYGLDAPAYQGIDQIVEIPIQEQKL